MKYTLRTWAESDIDGLVSYANNWGKGIMTSAIKEKRRIKSQFKKAIWLFPVFLFLLISCEDFQSSSKSNQTRLPLDVLDYTGTPVSPEDRSFLAFSDQGAWFAYGLPEDTTCFGGFSGPFLMTHGNGVWASKCLSQLKLIEPKTDQALKWASFNVSQHSLNSDLTQIYKNDHLNILMNLVFCTGNTAMISIQITNLSDKPLSYIPSWEGTIFSVGLQLGNDGDNVTIEIDESPARGIIQVFGDEVSDVIVSDSSYSISLEEFEIKAGETKNLVLTQSFIFPEYDLIAEQNELDKIGNDPNAFIEYRRMEKGMQLNVHDNKLHSKWKDLESRNLFAKCILTMQNNWRIPAGELKHAGLFPSYHYIWFHGFWAWDSWKHAVALAQYDPVLAQEQIRAMYDFLSEDGFIADCIYRDTTIEAHNFRNTKPPLSAWSAWKVFDKSSDTNFIKELYPKILLQHQWWYAQRDHDQDGLCEYGSTDGTLIAAKWESGMDNAVRFDDSKILKNNESAWSLNQESVDLNAYLYAEKLYLVKMATLLDKYDDAKVFEREALELKAKIQKQFFDPESGWFFDTNLEGDTFIHVMGCEGWIPLWAEVATHEQAEEVKNNMMNPELFYTRVPFQTLSASHPKFKPDGGYWRGPNWIDQSYFGIKGLHNYGFHEEAYDASYKLMHGAQGVMQDGMSIRENYNPITGEGLESENFSWSAAHYLLILLNE